MLQHDLGKEFDNALMKELAAILGYQVKTSSSYHPQSQGKVRVFGR